MKIKKDFVLRQMGDSWVAVPVGKMAAQIHGLVALNETAAAVWEILQTPRTLDQIVEELCLEYEGDPASIRENVEALVEQLEREGMLE